MVLRSTYVVEQLLFSIVASILIFDLDLIVTAQQQPQPQQQNNQICICVNLNLMWFPSNNNDVNFSDRIGLNTT